MSQRRRSNQDALSESARQLAVAGIATPRLDAEVLLQHVLGISRTELFLRYPDPIGDDDKHRYEELIERRLSGEPVAYLTGAREFMGLSFEVAPGVLIPRPETELLVEWALAALAVIRNPLMVDVGMGSGAIAISVVALATAPVRVVATDVSPVALGIARRNADAILNEVRRPWLKFQEGSLLEPISGQVNLVLANLPYLTPNQIAQNPDLAVEPRAALDGGVDGLDLVRDLIGDLQRLLGPGGGVGLELDPSQATKVELWLRNLYPGRQVRRIRDLAGLARHVVIEPHPTGCAAFHNG